MNSVGALGIEMVEPVAPVGERHVVGDADEIDRVVRPEPVQVEEDVARPVLRVVPEILRPVGGVAQLGAGPEDGPDIGGEVDELGDRRIVDAPLRTW